MNYLKHLLVISGPVGTIFYEILQLVLIFHVIYIFFNKNSFKYNILALCCCYAFFLHIIRFYLNFDLIIHKTKKYKYISFIAYLFLMYMITNKFKIKDNRIYLGLLYALLAITNLIIFKSKKNNLPKDVSKNRKIFQFIPLTLLLGYLAYSHRDDNILPILLGDFIYHFYDLIKYFNKE